MPTAHHRRLGDHRLPRQPGAGRDPRLHRVAARRRRAAGWCRPSCRWPRRIKQAADLADPASSFFVTFLAGARPDGAPATGALANDLAMAGRQAAAAYGELVDFLTDELAAQAPAGRRRRPRPLRAVVAGVRRRGRRPRRDLRVGPGGAGPDGGRAGPDRQPRSPGPGPRSRTPSRSSRPTRPAILHGTEALQEWMQATADEAIAALDGVHFDIPEPLKTHRVHDRPDRERRHLLHRPVRRLLPSGTDVVVGAAGRHRVQHLAREDHRLPRGRPRSSPADRAGRAEPRRS